jgi:DNA invertase Pin-like site-specific DNA recombinase
MIAYARVSTEEQAESGAGLNAQETMLERAFEYEGWELVELVRDEGASGKDLERPAPAGRWNGSSPARPTAWSSPSSTA